MGRPCSVCTNPRRKEIDEALLTGTPYRDIARRFQTSTAAAHRHSRHVQNALAAVASEDPVAYGRTVLAQVRILTERAVRILDRAENEGELRAATGAIREARTCLELVARLEGQIVERHAHIHQDVELRESKRREVEISALPDDLRRSLKDAARWLIMHNGREDGVDAEVVEADAVSVS